MLYAQWSVRSALYHGGVIIINYVFLILVCAVCGLVIGFQFIDTRR